MIKTMNKTLKQSESIQKSAIQYEKKEKPIPSRPLTSEIHLKMKPCWERFEEDKWNKENFKMSQSTKRTQVLEVKKKTKFLNLIGLTMEKFSILDKNY